MKICVLVPSAEQLKQAGVRIRYMRLREPLHREGHEITVEEIGAFNSYDVFVHDCYIISKCYGAASNIAAHMIKRSGKLLGVDLFDDYFSGTDSRLLRFRYWLKTMADLADFVLCSTPNMQMVAAQFAKGKPIHIMNDPAASIDAHAIAASARAKLEDVLRSRTLRVGWFGVGDNPYFSLGLADLASFSDQLRLLSRSGLDVHLEILTNGRAASAEGLAMLRRIGIDHTIEEWTEEREELLLRRSTVCFLPVNGQRFSAAKSLNRAVSALASGSQILSSGFPLYEVLAAFIYRDALNLLNDLERGQLAVREATVPELVGRLNAIASSSRETEELVAFLERLGTGTGSWPMPDGPPAAAVIHGQETTGEVHKFAQRLGILSVASPFTPPKMHFDLRFGFNSNGSLRAQMSSNCCFRLEDQIKPFLSPAASPDPDYVMLELPVSHAPNSVGLLARAGSPLAPMVSQASVIAEISRHMQRFFPGIACYLAEESRLPWWVEGDAGAGRGAA